MTRRIGKVAVIGSGIMGGGIAALCASAGIPTLLLDIVPFDLTDDEKNDPKAKNRIVDAGMQGIIKSRPAALMHKKDAQLIETGNLTDDFDKLKDVDLIVEVVVEDIKIKQDLFAKIDAVRKPDSIIASNTSGIPLKTMEEGRSQSFKEHVCILHFFNPVRYMKLLEVVGGESTKKDVVDFLADFGEKVLGKGIVRAKDTPGFIGNRIGIFNGCTAFDLQEKYKLDINLLDKVFGAPMGFPGTGMFGLQDLVGLDTSYKLTNNTYSLLGDWDEAKEIFKPTPTIQKMYENKMLGNKTPGNGGFYKNIKDENGKKQKLVLDIETFEFKAFDRKAEPEVVTQAKAAKTLAEKQKTVLYGDTPYSKFAWELMSACFIYSANRVPEISDTLVGIDNAMTWGYAWATGPFQMWDNIGVRESVEKMKADGLKVPEKIEKMLAGGNETFYRVENGKKQYWDFEAGSYKDIPFSESMIFLDSLKADNKVVKGNKSASLIDLGDGVYCVEFHTKMNSMNDEVGAMIVESLEYVKENGVGLVIGNQDARAFSAGGDLSYMGGMAKEGKFDDIDTMIKGLHDMIKNIRYSPFPVVAAPHGMTLGGGCEVCLAADMIVAHAETYMGLVEIGAGLLPGGGGNVNLWKRLVETIPGDVAVADLMPYFVQAMTLISTAKVSTSAAEARQAGFIRTQDRIIFNKDYLIGEAKKEVLRMVEDGYVAPAKTMIPVMGKDGQGIMDANLYNMFEGKFIPPHMKFITEKIAYVVSGGEASKGMSISEDYMLDIEREAFVELWKTENTRKMAEHIVTKGKPLMI